MRDLHHAVACRSHDRGVDLKRRPPKSRPTASPLGHRLAKADPRRSSRSTGTPPSTFLFLPIHMSNSPGPRRPHPPVDGEPSKPKPSKLVASDWDREPGHRISVRSFEDTPSRRGGGEPN